MRHPLASLLLLLTLTMPQAHAEALDNYRQFIVAGQTSKNEIREILGEPQETITDPGVLVWIYNEQWDVPWAVSLIPVVGDIADVASAIRKLQKDRELIIQFDPDGIVRKAKLRKLE